MFSWKIQTHFTGSSVIQAVAVSGQILSYQAQHWEHHNEAGGWSLPFTQLRGVAGRLHPPSLLPSFIIVSDLCGAVDQTQTPVQNSAIELHPWLLEDEAF